jgi:hypothetical protein
MPDRGQRPALIYYILTHHWRATCGHQDSQLRGEPTRWTALVYLLTYLDAGATMRSCHML